MFPACRVSDAVSVQQLMFGASLERRVTSSSQNHPSDAERDGVRDEVSTIWTVSVSECRGSNRERGDVPVDDTALTKRDRNYNAGHVFCWFLTGSREVSHIWRQNVWLACLAQRNGGRAGDDASDWFGADRKWSCSVFNLFKSSLSSCYSRNVIQRRHTAGSAQPTSMANASTANSRLGEVSIGARWFTYHTGSYGQR